MPLSERENYLRNVTMTGPEWMPCTVSVCDASWDQLREDLEDILLRHPLLFPDFQKGQRDFDNWEFAAANRAGERFTDAWGCVWASVISGLEGVVVEHPLADWDALDDYQPPDPLVQADRGPADWEAAFKLHAPYGTVVSGRVRGGRVEELVVQPESRRGDVVVHSEGAADPR